MANKRLVSTTINGEPKEFLCAPHESLLEVLRDNLGLTGSKEGCNNGNCGACTVILNGRPVDSCLVLGVEVEGAEVETVEGIAARNELHPVQECFLEGAACEHTIRYILAGYLFRCTVYDKIVRAVQDAGARMAESN